GPQGPFLPGSSVRLGGADVAEVAVDRNRVCPAYQPGQQGIADIARHGALDLVDNPRMEGVKAGIGQIGYRLTRLLDEAGYSAGRVDLDDATCGGLLRLEDGQGGDAA